MELVNRPQLKSGIFTITSRMISSPHTKILILHPHHTPLLACNERVVHQLGQQLGADCIPIAHINSDLVLALMILRVFKVLC